MPNKVRAVLRMVHLGSGSSVVVFPKDMSLWLDLIPLCIATNGLESIRVDYLTNW